METHVKRALTPAELDTILAAITNAHSTTQVLVSAMHATFDALLSDTGQSFEDFDADHRLDPGAFAIPTAQWKAIVQAITDRCQEWGTGPAMALDVINIMPSSYQDPDVPVPETAKADRRPHVHEMHVTREATDVIAACAHRVEELGNCFGRDSEEYLTALRSWSNVLSRLFDMGFGADTRVSKDGDLSLLVSCASGFVYGVIFHRTHPADPHGSPQPGEWSLHS
jgi:hypothetical protein